MRNFCMVFDGGFALSNRALALFEAMLKVEHIHVKEFTNPVEAYICGYNETLVRAGQPLTIPSFEEMSNNPTFFVPNYLRPTIDYRRLYVVLHPWYVGIITDEAIVAYVLDRLQYAEIREANSEADAYSIINFWYMQHHSMEAYGKQRVPMCPSIQLDVMSPVAGIQWFHSNTDYPFVEPTRAVASMALETEKDKEIFERLEENVIPKTIRHIVYQYGKPVR